MEHSQILQPSAELRSFLEPHQNELVTDTLSLLAVFGDLVDQVPSPPDLERVHDFAFVLFPIGKAYEGFLKTYFLRAGLISQDQYEGRHFRIGRSFNPDLPHKFRDDFWVFDDVAHMCSESVARQLWDAWVEGRNHLFHYFPHDRYDLTLPEARARAEKVLNAMEAAIACTE